VIFDWVSVVITGSGGLGGGGKNLDAEKVEFDPTILYVETFTA
jgi:hypothetical protein